MRCVPVWDAPVRLLHWGMVTAVAVAWWSRSDTGPLHENTGYVLIALVATRLAWGFCGGRYARFAQFVRAPGPTLAYARAAIAGHAPPRPDHPSQGAAMEFAVDETVQYPCFFRDGRENCGISRDKSVNI